jgi:hypothetical protein
MPYDAIHSNVAVGKSCSNNAPILQLAEHIRKQVSKTRLVTLIINLF